MTDPLDMREAQRLLNVAQDCINKLDGKGAPSPTLDRRDRNAILAALQRDLIFTAHLLDSARVAVMDEYHAMRGKTAHLGGDDG